MMLNVISSMLNINNMPIPDKGTLNVYTQKKDAGSFGSDTNWLFRILYSAKPFGKAETDIHDIQMNNLDTEIKKTGI